MAFGSADQFGTQEFRADQQDPIQFVRSAFEISNRYQQSANERYQSLYQEFKVHMDMEGKDPNMPHIKVPKARSNTKVQIARDMRSILGSEPWMPLQAHLKEYEDDVKGYQKCVRRLLDEGDYYLQMLQFIAMRRVFALSYMKVDPYRETEVINVPVERTVAGQVIELESVPVEVEILKMRFTPLAPWQVYYDPFATDMDHARWALVIQRVSRTEIKRLIEEGVYGNVDADQVDFQGGIGDFNSSLTSVFDTDWGQQLRSSLRMSTLPVDRDIGIHMTMMTKDRYVDILDLRLTLRDQPNPFAKIEGGHGEINLIRSVADIDPNPDTTFEGDNDLAANRGLFKLLDASWTNILQNQWLLNHGAIVFDPRRFKKDQIKMAPGVRIPRRGPVMAPGESVMDGIGQLKIESMDASSMVLPAAIDNMIDESTLLFDPIRGKPTTGARKTATEIGTLDMAGSITQEFSITLLEQMGVKGIGKHIIKHMNQFADISDYYWYIGSEAFLFRFLRIGDVPGGCKFGFIGAARLGEQAAKRRDMKEFFVVANQSVATNPSKNLEMLADAFQVSDDDKAELIFPPGYVQQQAMLEFEKEVFLKQLGGSGQLQQKSPNQKFGAGISQAGVNPTGKFRVRTPANTARELSNG